MVASERAPAAAHAIAGRPRVAMVIPTLNEEEPIAGVIRAIPRDVGAYVRGAKRTIAENSQSTVKTTCARSLEAREEGCLPAFQSILPPKIGSIDGPGPKVGRSF